MSIGGSSDKKGSPNGDYTDKELVMGKVTSSPNGEKVKSIHTDKELAKKLVLVLVLLLVITKQ